MAERRRTKVGKMAGIVFDGGGERRSKSAAADGKRQPSGQGHLRDTESVELVVWQER